MSRAAIMEFRDTRNTAALDAQIQNLKLQATGSKPPLSEDEVSMLLYFRKIELMVMVQYAKEISKMPSYMDADIREFSRAWEYEETRHGVAIQEYLRVHGHIFEPLTNEAVGWMYFFRTWALIFASWWYRSSSPAVHMLVGLFNEVTAKAGYWAYMKHTADPELRRIISLIQSEELRHLTFYQNKCLELIGDSKQKRDKVSKLAKLAWQPVGAGNGDIKPFAELLLKDDTIAQGFFKQIEERIQVIHKQLPDITDLVVKDLRTLVN